MNTEMQACLKGMRSQIARIEGCGIKAISDMAMDLRHQMITLTTLINGLEVDIATARMCGRAEPLKPQAPVDELPIFTQAARQTDGHALTVEEIEAMERTLHRAGDWTQDRTDLDDGEVRS